MKAISLSEKRPASRRDARQGGQRIAAFRVANHFLEHCENPIQTIVNFSRVLRDGGILYMAVPDKRFTFGVERPVTDYQLLSATFREGRRRDRDELYVEWARHVRRAPIPEAALLARQLRDDEYSIHFKCGRFPT
jgi:SAM-dependent methyltransferase